MPAKKKSTPLKLDNLNRTSDSSFTAIREAREWSIPDDISPSGEGSLHREEFDALLDSAVQGSKGGD